MVGLPEAARLVDTVRTLAEQRMHRERIAEQEAFARLRDGWTAIRQRRRADALRHNLIRFLGYERSEVTFHSRFLGDLLDPNGTHDQGTLFLGNFLELLSDRARVSGATWHYHWYETNELDGGSWLVLSERGKIDISIRNPTQGVLIFIENKIDAREQKNQLSRYFERLNREGGAYARRLLVFLSPKSYPLPQTGKPDQYLWLNYEGDIARWIKSVEDKLPDAAAALRGNLLQYRLVAEGLGERRTMPNQDVIDLIVKPENLPWALEIEGAMGEAKTQLLRKFWRGVDQALRSQLAELDLTTEFSVEGLSSLERDPRPKTGGVFLVQKGITPDRAHLKLGVFHEEAMIFPGIAFSHQQPVPNPLSEVRALCDALPESWRDLSDWWVGWREPGSNPKPNSGEFLHKVAIDCKAVAEAMTEALWDILWNQLGRIRSANRALQAAPSSG